jgi:hypothetical protein
MNATPPGSTSGGPNPLDPFNIASYYKRLEAEREILDHIKAQSEFLKTQRHFRHDILKNAKDLHRLQQQVRDIDEEDLGTYNIKLDLEKKLQNFIEKNKNAEKQILELRNRNTTESNKLADSISKQIKQAEEYNELLKEQFELSENIRKSLGVRLFSSLETAFGKFGGILGKLSPAIGGAEKSARVEALKLFKQNQISLEKSKLKSELEGLGQSRGVGITDDIAKKYNLLSRTGRPLAGSAAANKARSLAASMGDPGPILSKSTIGMKSLQAGFKALGPIIMKSLGPLAIITGIVEVIKFFINAMMAADKQVTAMAKSFNVTKESAREARDRFFELSDNAGRFTLIQKGNLLLQKDIVDANLKINDLLGTAIDLSYQLGEEGKNLVTQFANASKFLGLSEEEQKGLLRLYAISGKEVDDIKISTLGIARNFKLQTGILIDERKVLRDVLTTSNAVKLSIQGGSTALVQAVINAQLLGTTLDRLENTANAVLQFETSIKDELGAELLLGKNINLERLRYASLTNDTVTVTEEVNRLVRENGAVIGQNRIVAAAFARTLGISREEFADMVVSQDTLNKLRDRYNTLGKETIKNLYESGKIDKATFDSLISGRGVAADYYNALRQVSGGLDGMNQMLGEQALKSLESQDIQAKFNDALLKLQEVFTRLVDGGFLDKIIDGIIGFASYFVDGDLKGEYQAAKAANPEGYNIQSSSAKMQQNYNEFKKTHPNTTFEEYQRNGASSMVSSKPNEGRSFSSMIGRSMLSSINPVLGNIFYPPNPQGADTQNMSATVTPKIASPQQFPSIPNTNYKSVERKEHNDLVKETRETNKLIKEQNQLMAQVVNRPVVTKISPYELTRAVTTYAPKQSSKLGAYNA